MRRYEFALFSAVQRPRGASGTERTDLFAGTAVRFYRLNGIG